MHQYHIFPTADEMALAATNHLIDVCKTVIAEKGRCVVCLSGGSTPKRMFKLLATTAFKSKVEWEKVVVFWGDERTVPQSSPDSNSGEAMRLLFDQVPVPDHQIFPIDGAANPTVAAEQYEAAILDFFGNHPPVFDLCFLGMGDDGHTASLFPFTDIVYEEERLVKEVFVEKLETDRISLTPSVINQSARIVFLIGGANKANVLEQVIDGDFNPERYPSQLVIRKADAVTFFLDKSAAGRLDVE